MSTKPAQAPVVPENAPPVPENVILKHHAWAPMWIENSNVVVVVVGDPGDGKSWASLRLAELIDPTFDIDRVAWDIVEFMELVVDDSLGQGQVIILEEGSVEASAYDWHSVSNDVFRKVLDTWRHQNRMAIINLPSFAALEKGARRRTEAIVEMTEAKPWKDYSQAKFKLVNYNNIDDHFSTPFPIIESKQRKHIRFKQPSDELIEAYEVRKQQYTAELNEELLDKLIAESDEKDEEKKNPKDIAIELADGKIKSVVSEDRRDGSPYINVELIRVQYDISNSDARAVKGLLNQQYTDEQLEEFI